MPVDSKFLRAIRIAGGVISSSSPLAYAVQSRPVRAEGPGKGDDHKVTDSCGPRPQERADILQHVVKIRSVYRPAYAFPRWVADEYISKNFESYQTDASHCSIFFDEDDAPGLALLLAAQREPVNIGMKRLYEESRLEELFGWRRGLYGVLADGIFRCPPNIAIMCPTPVVSGLPGPDAAADEGQAQSIRDANNRVHVLSVIAYAFDSPQQPDQQHFLERHGSITAAKRKELVGRFERIFDKIFAASLHYNRSVVVLSKFGAGAFAENFPGDLFRDVWLPAFGAALEAWKGRLKSAGVTELSLMGGEADDVFVAAVRAHGFSSQLYSYFPDPIRQELGAKLARAVLVNAWDSWSLIGNGNFADRSLDGFVGRATALAVLGWPVTNPYLQHNLVRVTRPKPPR
mmetsp:Transcript_21081/g.60843  ORF Transcript_21081/g.60843 Transcript_21081/m.60843 type:complete len:402 (+) Transcript_21081:117-1322(+)